MPKSPDTSTIINHSGKTIVTIPKPLVNALGIEPGQKVKWKAIGKGKLEIQIL